MTATAAAMAAPTTHRLDVDARLTHHMEMASPVNAATS